MVNKKYEVDESETKRVQLSHNGKIIGTGEVSVYGDVVGLNLDADGAQLFLSKVSVLIEVIVERDEQQDVSEVYAPKRDQFGRKYA